MGARDYLLAIVALLSSGAFVGGIVAYRKAGAEKHTTERQGDQIVVETAQLLIGMSREEIERLDQANDRLQVQIDEVRHELGKRIGELEDERDRLQADNDRLTHENEELSDRVRQLEEEVVQLREGQEGVSSS